MVISRDITERKQRMQEIQMLKERFELAVEGANLGVWDWDMTTDDVEFNDQWAEMLGYTLEELEPHLRTWKTRIHPDDIEQVKAALDAHIQQETDYYDTTHRLRTADGEWTWIRDLGKIVERDSDGEPLRAVGVHLDINEARQYQRELEQKTERLEEFASIVSHDLRNPLAVAAGNLELARDDCESPHLERVERAHGRMEALIEDLLTLAQEGEAVTDTEAVNLATVVGECWEVVETAESSLTIKNDRAVEADTSRLKQLLENLFRNAIEHGGEEVTVTVGGLEDGFYIEDDGPGVPVTERDEVFEAGYTSNPDGTGFGLSIVKRVVEAHNWEIEMVEGIDGGARFEITGVEMTER
jgi:PAS domain S-box-containing protein